MCYDLPAMILITSGSIIIAINANKEQVDFTPDEIKALLLSPSTIFYLITCTVLILAESSVIKLFLSKLRRFEADAVAYQESHSSYVMDNQQQYSMHSNRSAVSGQTVSERLLNDLTSPRTPREDPILPPIPQQTDAFHRADEEAKTSQLLEDNNRSRNLHD